MGHKKRNDSATNKTAKETAFKPMSDGENTSLGPTCFRKIAAIITKAGLELLRQGLAQEGIGYQKKRGKKEWRTIRIAGDIYSEWKIRYWKESNIGVTCIIQPQACCSTTQVQHPTCSLRALVQERQDVWPRLELAIYGFIWARPEVKIKGWKGAVSISQKFQDPDSTGPESQGSVQTWANIFGLKWQQAA